jgi:hypothetical protein
MSFQSGLFALLRADAGVMAVVSERIFPVLLPENATLPALTYHVVGGSSAPTFATSGMQKVRIQFDCFARSYLDADRARDALRQSLYGYRGTLADGTFLQNAELIQSVDFFDNDPRQFRCMSEFYFYFTFSS